MSARAGIAIVLINNTQVGGAERRFARVWKGLCRRGRPATLIINRSLSEHLVRAGILPDSDGAMVTLAEPFGTLASLLFGLPDRRAGLAARLGFWLSKLDYLLGACVLAWWSLRQRPRLVHLVLGGAYLAWPAQVLRLMPPAVLSIVCQDLREMVGSAVGERLYRRALGRAAVIDALTEPIRDGLVQSGTSAHRIRVSSGSFVDTDRYRPVEQKEPWVVLAGRWVDEKNPLLFIEACALIRDRLADHLSQLRFYLVGDGPLRGEIEQAIARHGLAARIETGWRDDVETILGAAQVFVSLQRTDNYPSQALLEAMACECAVVATDVGQTVKLVDDRVGTRVSPDPNAVADAVCRFMEDPVQARALGREGRRRVLTTHSAEAYLDYVESLYAAVTGGSSEVKVTGLAPSRLTPHA